MEFTAKEPKIDVKTIESEFAALSRTASQRKADAESTAWVLRSIMDMYR